MIAPRLAFVLAAMLMLAGGGAAAQGKAKGGGPTVDAPKAWETETPQAGGRGSAQYLFVGTLRCKAAGQGIVGARVLRSQLVDQIQIGCAKVECEPSRGCTWDKLDRGMFAGEAGPDSKPGIGVCPHDSVIAGYRARIDDDRVAQVEFECAQLAFPPPGAARAQPKAGIPVAPDVRSWISFAEADPPAGAASAAPPRWDAQGHCPNRAASGISVAISRLAAGGNAQVHALSLFCVRGPAEQPDFAIDNAPAK